MFYTTSYSSPFGTLKIIGSESGIRSVQLSDDSIVSDFDLPQIMLDCVQQLEEYFKQERKKFDLKLDLNGHTKFNRSVWNALLDIPYGKTNYYSSIATDLGNPKSVRAVGQANRHNPIAIIIPCHRCIAKNGDLQGYFYGVDMKRRLLELENPKGFAIQGSLF